MDKNGNFAKLGIEKAVLFFSKEEGGWPLNPKDVTKFIDEATEGEASRLIPLLRGVKTQKDALELLNICTGNY